MHVSATTSSSNRLFGQMRRSILIAGAAAFIATVGVSDAEAKDKKVLLKTPVAFNTELPVLGDTIKWFADNVKAVSGGTIRVKTYEPGKLVPAFQIHESVSTGKVDAGYTASAYLGGSLKESIIFCTFPFAPDAIPFLAWFYEGNGLKLYQKMYDDAGYNVKAFPLAVMTPEGGGWFTKKIEKPEDWKGVKLRIGGFASSTLKKLGAVPTLIPGGEIFSGLEKGVIDGAEMGVPAADIRAGFYKVAKFYHMPGWQQPTTFMELIINKDVWKSMSETQQAQFEAAVRAANVYSITKSTSAQAAALKEIESKGVEIVRWNDTMLNAMRKAFDEVMVETTAAHPNVKVIWDDLKAFMASYKFWEGAGYIPRSKQALQ